MFFLVSMDYMRFRLSLLESIFKSFKWTRNNSLLMFQTAQKSDLLAFAPKNSTFQFQSILFQFQCLITTTDTYYRLLTEHKNKDFGVFIKNNHIVQKKDIAPQQVEKLLRKQLIDLQTLLQTFDEKKTQEQLQNIISLGNHEYLHQGQLLVMFRQGGIDVPERFKKAWNI